MSWTHRGTVDILSVVLQYISVMVLGDHIWGVIYTGSWAPCCVTSGASNPVRFTNAPIHISVMPDYPNINSANPTSPVTKTLGPVYPGIKTNSILKTTVLFFLLPIVLAAERTKQREGCQEVQSSNYYLAKQPPARIYMYVPALWRSQSYGRDQTAPTGF